MNIEGLGEALVDQLLSKGLVHNIADLYSLRGRRAAAAGAHGQEERGECARARLKPRRNCGWSG